MPTRTGKLKDIKHFDANFFGVHAKQADVMDPQLRTLLECTYESIADAGKTLRHDLLQRDAKLSSEIEEIHYCSYLQV